MVSKNCFYYIKSRISFISVEMIKLKETEEEVQYVNTTKEPTRAYKTIIVTICDFYMTVVNIITFIMRIHLVRVGRCG